MSRITEFLESLNDAELSFLFKYKYPSYLDNSQIQILKEIEKRNLTPTDQENYIRKYEFNPGNTGCPRCNSAKSISQQVQFYNTSKEKGLDNSMKYTEIRDCAVCGYNLYDGNEKPAGSLGIWNAITNILFRKLR